MITCLVSPEGLSSEKVQITGDRYRHLFRARRVPKGARIRLVDGEGRARWGCVAEVGLRSAEIVLEDPAPTHEAPCRVLVLVAALRAQRASWLVEKATELGVAEIRFLETSRTTHRLSEAHLDRLRRVSESALEQCHGSRLPRLTGPHAFGEIYRFLEPCSRRAFLDLPRSGESGRALPAGESAAMLVGPEGGWSDGERAQLQEWGCQPVSLGERTLRVETAVIVGLGGLLQSCWGGRSVDPS